MTYDVTTADARFSPQNYPKLGVQWKLVYLQANGAKMATVQLSTQFPNFRFLLPHLSLHDTLAFFAIINAFSAFPQK